MIQPALAHPPTVWSRKRSPMILNSRKNHSTQQKTRSIVQNRFSRG